MLKRQRLLATGHELKKHFEIAQFLSRRRTKPTIRMIHGHETTFSLGKKSWNWFSGSAASITNSFVAGSVLCRSPMRDDKKSDQQ
jgi:hypothetical protein